MCVLSTGGSVVCAFKSQNDKYFNLASFVRTDVYVILNESLPCVLAAWIEQGEDGKCLCKF